MYYDNFEKVAYLIKEASYGSPAQYARLTDITKNVRFRKEILGDVSLYDEYILQDNETLEQVSEYLYDSPHYNWILMLMNGIYDPKRDQIMSQEVFEQYLVDKYKENIDGYEDYSYEGLLQEVIRYTSNLTYDFVNEEGVYCELSNYFFIDANTGNATISWNGSIVAYYDRALLTDDEGNYYFNYYDGTYNRKYSTNGKFATTVDGDYYEVTRTDLTITTEQEMGWKWAYFAAVLSSGYSGIEIMWDSEIVFSAMSDDPDINIYDYMHTEENVPYRRYVDVPLNDGTTAFYRYFEEELIPYEVPIEDYYGNVYYVNTYDGINYNYVTRRLFKDATELPVTPEDQVVNTLSYYDYEVNKNEERRVIKVLGPDLLPVVLKNFKDIM